MEAVEGGLHQGRHDTAQAGLIRTAAKPGRHAPCRAWRWGAEEGSPESHPEPTLGRRGGLRLPSPGFRLRLGPQFPTVQWGEPPHWMEAEVHIAPQSAELILPSSPSSNPP